MHFCKEQRQWIFPQALGTTRGLIQPWLMDTILSTMQSTEGLLMTGKTVQKEKTTTISLEIHILLAICDVFLCFFKSDIAMN